MNKKKIYTLIFNLTLIVCLKVILLNKMNILKFNFKIDTLTIMMLSLGLLINQKKELLFTSV